MAVRTAELPLQIVVVVGTTVIVGLMPAFTVRVTVALLVYVQAPVPDVPVTL